MGDRSFVIFTFWRWMDAYGFKRGLVDLFCGIHWVVIEQWVGIHELHWVF